MSSAIGRTVITICKLEVKKLTDDVFKESFGTILPFPMLFSFIGTIPN